MPQSPILVVGAAPAKYVRECLAWLRLRGDHEPPVVLAKHDRFWLSEQGCRVHTFNRFLSWRSPALIGALLRYRPREVFIVCGDDYTQQRVVYAVALYKTLFRSRLTIFIHCRQLVARVECVEDWLDPHKHYGVASVLATLALLASLLVVGWWVLPVWASLLAAGLLVAVELLLQTTEPQQQLFRDRRKQPPTLVALRLPKVRDENRLLFQFRQVDPCLGWFNFPRLGLHYSCAIPELDVVIRNVYRTDEQGRRLTGAEVANDQRPRIAIHGCSLTFGIGLNDEQTYPWLLQARMPAYRVLNYGCLGYSLYQSLLLLERTIARDRPEVVVIGFSPELARRNTNHLAHRINVGYTCPSCLWSGGRLRRYAPIGYRRFFLSRELTLVRMLEISVNRLLARGRSHPRTMLTTCQQVLNEIKACCAAHGVKLLIVCLDVAPDYYDFLDQGGFSWCDPGIDVVADHGRWTLRPYDGHPNADAQQQYVATIEPAIRELLHGHTVRPRRAGGGALPGRQTWRDTIYPLF